MPDGFIFMLYKGHVHLIALPEKMSDREAYWYAREKLQVGEQETTVWERAVFKESIAQFNFEFTRLK